MGIISDWGLEKGGIDSGTWPVLRVVPGVGRYPFGVVWALRTLVCGLLRWLV
jgi:hypothetical protein